MPRTVVLAAVMALAAWLAPAGEQSRVFFPDLLPSNTILCLVPPDDERVDYDFSQTIFARIAELPEMGPFLRSFEESRRQLAHDITQTAGVQPEFAQDLVGSRLGLALINIAIGRDGKPQPEFAFAISLNTIPDRDTVFSAVMALLNRPEVVRTVLESQGIDPSLPLRTIVQEETVTNGPPILRIGPNIRVAAIGNLVLIYHGPGSEGIRKIFNAARNPNASLSRNPTFQAAYRGAEADPGSSFYYFNLPRVTAILDATNNGGVTRVLDALGFGSAQSLAISGSFHNEGVRHTLFLHNPGASVTGILSSLIPMPPESPVGVETYAQTVPSSAHAFTAVRVDMGALIREIPYFVEAMRSVTTPGGITGVLANERVLGVPVGDIIATLGTDIVIRPHDDTQVAIFNSVDVAGFEGLVGRMEANAGQRFNSINVGGYIVRYYNKRSSLSAPLAPAFCLVPRSPGNPQGILYMASHPQAVVSLIQESTAAREPLSSTPDFARAVSGIGGNYSLFYYNGSRDPYRRVYNFLLPVLSLWSSSSRYPVDTGLLPTANALAPAMFGSSCGIRLLPEGLQMQAFSPIGGGALLVQALDKMVVSNPLVIAYVYGALEAWMKTLPAW